MSNYLKLNIKKNFKFLKNNKLTASIRSKDKTDSQKGEKEFDKLVVFDDKQEEKEDEFIVKMLIRPMTEGEEGGAGVHGRQVGGTLTQLIRKKGSHSKAATEDEMINVDDEQLNESISSQDLEDGAATANSKEGRSTRRNKLVYLCALEDSTKQKVAVLKILYQTRPKYVILYDSVLWFVRQLEVYKAIHCDLDMRVYFMMYTNSCEEQRYLTSVRCEKESFEILIREKAVIILSLC